MLVNTDKKILIVGLGLIGGCYARGFHKSGYTVYAINRSKEAIDYALEEGFIDKGATFADPDIISDADIIVMGQYPKVVTQWIKDNQKYFKSGAIVTDVTGVKSCIVYEIQDILRDDVEFIAAHPMAGREVSGVQNSDEKILLGANYIIVPTSKNTKQAIEVCREIGLILHFGMISELSPEEHDEIIGFVSQLTHCIAISLMNCSDNEKLVDYVGDSFRDLTRIARINENMWSELFILNKQGLIKDMDRFIEEITKLRDMVAAEDADGLKEKMIISTERRNLFDKK